MFLVNTLFALNRIYLAYYSFITVAILVYLLVFKASFIRISAALLSIVLIMFTHILLQLLTGFTLTVAIFAFDLPDSCVAKSCERIADGQCDLSIEHWAVYKYIGQTNCACCKGERDAAMIVGQ